MPVASHRRDSVLDESAFIAALVAISKPTALWLPRASDTTTNVSPPDTRTWTHGAPGGLVTNGDFETDTFGWGGLSSGSIAQSTSHPAFGTHSLAVTVTGTNDGCANSGGITKMANGTDYAWSASVWAPTGMTVKFFVQETVAFSTLGSVTVTGNDALQRVSFTATGTANSATGTRIVATQVTTNVAGTFWLDGVRQETGTVATPFGMSSTPQGNGILVTFNGTSDNLSADDTGLISGAASRSMIALIKPTAVNVTDNPIFGYGSASAKQGLFWELLNAKQRIGVFGTNSDAATTSQVVGKVALVGWSLNGGTGVFTFYNNGAADGAATAIASINTTLNGTAYIADTPAPASWLLGNKGNITTGFVAQFSGALTAAQHLAIRNLASEYYGASL